MNDDDLLRPLLHFTARAEWINDPNGLVYADGEYHLFFQTNPVGSTWGNMSWGHAVSRDLLTWTIVDTALEPYPARDGTATTMIFSGSAVATGPGRLRAYYTAHERQGDEPLNESVAVAESDDSGRSWRFHAGNPVLDTSRRDFRDPKVWWHAATAQWVMVVAAAVEQAVEFYTSDDGLGWCAAGRFSDETSEPGALWECPDLFRVTVRGGTDTRWALVVSTVHRDGSPFTAMRYWIGDFDGATFTAEGGWQTLDHGKDYFAGVTFNGLPLGSAPVMIAWACDWAYASATPTIGWRGAMAIPRALELGRAEHGWTLVQSPVPQYESALGERIERDERALAADVRFVVDGGRCGIVRCVTSDTEWLEVGLDLAAGGAVWIDRRSSGNAHFHDRFATLDRVPLRVEGAATVEVHVIVDHSVIEVFLDGGRLTMCEVVYPTAPWRVECTGAAAGAEVRSLRRPAC